MTYRGQGMPIDIGKAKNNFDKDKKPKYFNCNIYKHMAKDCRKPKKKKDTRKYYKCKKIGHIAKNCKTEQKIKNWSIQKNTNTEYNDKGQSFVDGPK